MLLRAIPAAEVTAPAVSLWGSPERMISSAASISRRWTIARCWATVGAAIFGTRILPESLATNIRTSSRNRTRPDRGSLPNAPLTCPSNHRCGRATSP